MRTRSFTRGFLSLLSGPMIWAGHFLVLYGVTGLLCARPSLRMQLLGFDIIGWWVLLSSAVAVAAILLLHAPAWFGRGNGDEETEFATRVGAGLGLLSIVAVIWEAMPALLVPYCA